MIKTILVVCETKAGEARVALVPDDAKLLVKKGFRIIVESGAGKLAGFTDDSYIEAGCQIRVLASDDVCQYKKFFAEIDLIIRAKRPDPHRELLENQAIAAGTIMIGALDVLERDSAHISQYKERGIKFYSIDQFGQSDGLSLTILDVMSSLAGELALKDALLKLVRKPQKIVIIGTGRVGMAAYKEALKCDCVITLIGGESLKVMGLPARSVVLGKNESLEEEQQKVAGEIADADIVITSARQNNQVAPLLVPMATLSKMQAGSVVVDMALSEGGNVEGAMHDATLMLGNQVLVTNVSGYPKMMPHEASVAWSKCSVVFIKEYLKLL